MSNVPVAWFTEPAPRNSNALKKACVNRWNIAATMLPTPRPIIMYPNWLIVEYAITRLISVATIPIVAPTMAVTAPMAATVLRASSDAANTGNSRATRYSPAATIVAAWISAETGVGPSIASGSHTCSGNCADFPAAPAKIPSENQVTTLAPIAPAAHANPLGPPPPRRVLVEPEPDQQVRAEPHHLPEHEQLQDVRGQQQPQHRRREQRHEGVVAVVARVAPHVF